MDAHNQSSPTAASETCARQCPSVGGEPGSLITHVISPSKCLERQRGFYHKCHRCDYRGKPADFRLEALPAPSANGTSLNGATISRRADREDS